MWVYVVFFVVAFAQGIAYAADDPVLEGSDKGKKTKTYNFSGLDIEGKLKTPQLLYFLGRMKLEYELSKPAKRSFIPELERSGHDRNLR